MNDNTLFMNGALGKTASLSGNGNAYSGILIDTNSSHVTANNNTGGLGGIFSGASGGNRQMYLINNQSANYVTMMGNMGNSHWGDLVVYTATNTNVVNVNNNGN